MYIIGQKNMYYFENKRTQPRWQKILQQNDTDIRDFVLFSSFLFIVLRLILNNLSTSVTKYAV